MMHCILKFILVGLIFLQIINGVSAAPAPEIQKTDLYFTISAIDLPDTDNLGYSSPDPYVEIAYSGHHPYTRKDPYVTKTEMLPNNHNPVWLEVFHVTYHHGEGNEQMLEFKVFDHNRFTKNKNIGTVSLSVAEMISNAEHKFERDIIGPKKQTGKLLIYTRVNDLIEDDTDLRLRTTPKSKFINIGGHLEVKYVE